MTVIYKKDGTTEGVDRCLGLIVTKNDKMFYITQTGRRVQWHKATEVLKAEVIDS